MVWKADGPECNEAAKIRWELVPYTRGYGYDLGCGPYKGFPHFIGVDNCTDVSLFNIHMKPDLKVPDCAKLDKFASQSADFIFSSHLLEHIVDYKAALKEWFRVVKVGGYLCLYLPHKDFYPNVGVEGSNPDHKHDFTPADIIAAMEALDGWDLVENQERNEGEEYSFFMVFKKLGHKVHLRSCDNPKPAKTCAVVRYGAYGDLLMAASIFPKLKAEGYHITLYSVPRGYEVVKHDPHIDKVILQDPDQVPNQALGEFFEHIAKKYDRFINLSESVEGTFLAIPDRAPYRFPHEVRHKLMNRNYVEFAHELAGVPYDFAQKFYATKDEKEWAKKERQKIGGDLVVLWSLAGSSVHKTWPHMDTIIARLLMLPRNVRIVLVGGEECKLLEAGWELESRVACRAGAWSIRESLAFLEQSDLVIGPETGVMNAAAMMPVPKIVTLSHSSHENLTRDWVNVTALEPKNTPCYPCHKLIFGFHQCVEGLIAHPENVGETLRVGSLCQVNITPEQMWDAIVPIIHKREAA